MPTGTGTVRDKGDQGQGMGNEVIKVGHLAVINIEGEKHSLRYTHVPFLLSGIGAKTAFGDKVEFDLHESIIKVIGREVELRIAEITKIIC